jgi:hypothetical protein
MNKLSQLYKDLNYNPTVITSSTVLTPDWVTLIEPRFSERDTGYPNTLGRHVDPPPDGAVCVMHATKVVNLMKRCTALGFAPFYSYIGKTLEEVISKVDHDRNDLAKFAKIDPKDVIVSAIYTGVDCLESDGGTNFYIYACMYAYQAKPVERPETAMKTFRIIDDNKLPPEERRPCHKRKKRKK